MSARVLITGGAGFIGSHAADELLKHGCTVRVLDALVPQVHGAGGVPPDYLSPHVELIVGDVRDPDVVRGALREVDLVLHLAAAVGVGQSMYEIQHYTSVNNLGTAVLLEALAGASVQRLVVASSMSVYGEGLYRDAHGAPFAAATRSAEALRTGQWEPHDDQARPLHPLATPEDKPPDLSSIYALSKFDQERMCLLFGRAYNVPVCALRFFNVFGPRQALSNPYTGVLAIFASRYLNDQPPLIFEDGEQRRDFVSVYDVARACRLAFEKPEASDRVLNIGSGRSQSINQVAEALGAVLNRTHIEPRLTGRYRVGDIRHCFADISAAETVLGYRPQVDFEAGLVELAEWLATQQAVDNTEAAHAELAQRGLTL